MRRQLLVYLICPLTCLISSVANTQPFPARIDLGEIPIGEGFSMQGAEFNDTGWSVAGIGDLNHDGFDDVAVSAIRATNNNGDSSGVVYVFLGFPAANFTSLEFADLNGSNGFRIDGVSDGDNLGWSLAGVGDVNDDGIDDLLIGALSGDANGSSAGESYLLFGRQTFPPTLDLSQLDGTDGARIDGITSRDYAGGSVSGAGDVNGDGIDDILIGADGVDANNTNSGEAYVGFGRTTWPETLQLSSLNGMTGFALKGRAYLDRAGGSVSAAGDVNGDGLADIIVGAVGANPNGDRSGESYLVFGRKVQQAAFELEDLDGSNGVTLHGIGVKDFSGASVSGVGDLNHDGFDDVLIGSPGDLNQGTGSAAIVYGRASWNATVELSQLDGTDGVQLNGVDNLDQCGDSVSAAGDFNGDGFPDVIIGALAAGLNHDRSGEAYVVFGNEELPNPVELGELDGLTGVTLEGEDEFDLSGGSVASAGDFNGDGIGDVIVGGKRGNKGYGIAHVVFGRFETGIALGATAASCPGPVQFRLKGLTPEGELEIYRGTGRGNSIIHTGPCTGSELDLENALLIRTVESNDLGQWLLSVEVANEAVCGTFIQIIDRTTCLLSNVTTLPSQ